MNLNLSLQQQQQLSQTQIQSLEILAMDNVELNQFLKNEYLENPMLEHNEEAASDTTTEPLTSYYEHSFDNNFNMYNSTDDECKRTNDFSAPSENVLRDYLLTQLDIKLYSRKEWKLFIYLIGCLDDSGFFSMSPKEVAEKMQVPEALVLQSLSTLRTLEPYGIFSENLQQSLLRQLDALDINNEILSRMISCHLQDIADGKISNISRELHISTVEVRKNIELISRLNPRPLAGFGSERNSYIIPDIIFQKNTDNSWNIQLNDEWTSNYLLNDYYLKMMQNSTNEELTAYFRAKLNRVQFILSSIEQRRKTILSVSQVILKKQMAFFEQCSSLLPMTMSEVAEEAGMHTSTVSRAMKGKYLQYPGGNIFAKNLFTSFVSSSGSESITPMLVKQYIREFIESEDKKKPYSDQTLSRLLEKHDIKISRRAIAKYREELGIRGSFDRKCY